MDTHICLASIYTYIYILGCARALHAQLKSVRAVLIDRNLSGSDLFDWSRVVLGGLELIWRGNDRTGLDWPVLDWTELDWIGRA